MRKVIVGMLAAGAVIATAGPAAAGSPAVQQKSCQAAQGVFTQVHGTKTCAITVETTEVTPISNTYTDGAPPLTHVWTAVTHRTEVFRTTTYRTQKGNGTVGTRFTTVVVSSTVEEFSCTMVQTAVGDAETVVTTFNYPLSECEGQDLFVGEPLVPGTVL